MNSELVPAQFGLTYARFTSNDQVHFSIQATDKGAAMDYPVNNAVIHPSFLGISFLCTAIIIIAAGLQLHLLKRLKLG